MPDAKPFHHRSSLKQHNKPFKASTRASKSAAGRTAVSAPVKSQTRGLSKADRKNRRRLQMHAAKQRAAEDQTLWTAMPRIVAVIPLTSSACRSDVAGLLNEKLRVATKSKKQREVHFISTATTDDSTPDAKALQALRLVATSDIVLFVVDAVDDAIDSEADRAMALLKQQGMPTEALLILSASTGANNSNANALLKAKWNGDKHRSAFVVDRTSLAADQHDNACAKEINELTRFLHFAQLHVPVWRASRPYMLVDRVEGYDRSTEEIWVTGYVRGGNWHATQRMHLVGHGDFLANVVPAANEPSAHQLDGPECEEDGMEGQQYSSIYEPLSIIEDKAKPVKDGCTAKTVTRKIVPEGTSVYQAAWMPSSDEASASDDPDGNQMDLDKDAEMMSEDACSSSDDEQDEGTLSDASDDEIDEKIRRLVPDVVPLPDEPVQMRYAHYRGVDNPRTAEWHYEDGDVPALVEQCVDFADIRASRKAALAEQAGGQYRRGARLTVSIKSVPLAAAEHISSGIAMWALLKHEDKPAMLHFAITPTIGTLASRYENKQDVVALIDGFRLLRICPLYSEHSSDSLHRRQKQLGELATCVASFLGPVCITSATSILLFDPSSLALIASGGLLDMSPWRVIAKRITLVGRPFRIHRRTTTIRHLFSHPSDVPHYRPVALHTRSRAVRCDTGRAHRRVKGHLVESLGEHGKCKAHFERQIQADDLVCMHLYKRVWPAWNTRLYKP